MKHPPQLTTDILWGKDCSFSCCCWPRLELGEEEEGAEICLEIACVFRVWHFYGLCAIFVEREREQVVGCFCLLGIFSFHLDSSSMDQSPQNHHHRSRRRSNTNNNNKPKRLYQVWKGSNVSLFFFLSLVCWEHLLEFFDRLLNWVFVKNEAWLRLWAMSF